VKIRSAARMDRDAIGEVHVQAFGAEEGPSIAALVNDLRRDETAAPLLSLVAVDRERLIGHILYSRVRVVPCEDQVSARILAPLAVLPEAWGRGVGGRLIRTGLNQLQSSGVELVFVLGHPGYYSRFGFEPAGIHGLAAPYPIPEARADAWMVRELASGAVGSVTGKVQCARVLDQPEHWQE